MSCGSTKCADARSRGWVGSRAQHEKRRPAFEIAETASGFTTIMDILGASHQPTELRLESDVLQEAACCAMTREEPGYRQAFGLPQRAGAAAKSAGVSHGVLMFRILKTTGAYPGRIAVTTNRDVFERRRRSTAALRPQERRIIMLARRTPVLGNSLDLRSEIDRLFDSFFEGKPLPSDGIQAGEWAPALDISERPDAIVVTADVPGVPADRIEVTVSDGLLTIRGDRDETKTEKAENFHRVERSYGSFLRRIAIPTPVDEGKVNATMKDGVLTVELKKSAAAQPRRIAVKASGG